MSIEPDESAISPRTRIRFKITYTYSGADSRAVVLDDFVFDVRLINEKAHFIGRLFVETPYVKLNPSNSCMLETFLELDFHKLNQIEKLREGKNLVFEVIGKFFTENEKIREKNMQYFRLEKIKIPKSQWVEEILSKVGFKDVSLLEIPKLPSDEYKEVVKWVDNAWKQYMMGEYDKVLGDCRNALEGLTERVKDRGFRKTTVEDDEKRIVPDWDKFFGNEDLGDIFGSICKKMFGFTTAGRHFGKGINREDADLALMAIHSMVNFIIKKTPS